MPLFGVWGHRYIRVKKRYPLRSKRILGIHVVWTSYRRLPEEGSQTSYAGDMASHDSANKKPGSL